MLGEVYIISDLHLGGSPALELTPGHSVPFQLCGPLTRRRLAQFVRRIMARHPDRSAELVINGDFVDFLAEESAGEEALAEESVGVKALPRFDAFTHAEVSALAKLQRVITRCADPEGAEHSLFPALQDFVRAGYRLTLLLGNHDIELALPAVRHWLEEWLTDGRPHRLTFIHDGQAYARHGVLIEHGNRYDGWNAVDHHALRALRSRLSRGEPGVPFSPPPGSRLVVEVMNEIKLRYPFIDLLKPENEAVIPLLGAIAPDLVRSARRIARGLHIAWLQRGRVPGDGELHDDPALIGSWDEPVEAVGADRNAAARTEQMFALTDADNGEIGVIDGLKGMLRTAAALWPIVTAAPDERLIALRRGWRAYAAEIGATFQLDCEIPRYVEAARRLCPPDGVVIFGHTHLARSVPLDGKARYLNTGTWCPTVEIPPTLYDPAIADADTINDVRDFVEKLCAGTAALRHRCPFGHVRWQAGEVQASLREFLPDGTDCEIVA